MPNFTIEEYSCGETLDPQKPAYIGIGENILKATLDEFFKLHAKMSNQVRRFKRQQQILEAKSYESSC